jgi:hypothetical protein
MKIRFAAFFALIFAAACSNEQPAADPQDSAQQDTLVGTVEILETNTLLPSPIRVAAMFKRSGLKYLPGITNGTDKASTYNNTFSRALNMGVYTADMSYCVINKQTNEAQKYLKTTRDLGSLLNLGKVFEETDLYDRFNKNLDNEDSLSVIVADIQYKTDEQLDANQQSEIYGVIFAGAWVEAMYIGGEVYRKDGNQDIVTGLLEQMAVCKNIIAELKSNEAKDPSITGLIADLNEIQLVIDQMPSMKKLDENPKLGLHDVHPSKEELEPVIQKVSEIRAKIING